MLLSYFGHAYVWADSKPAGAIPACIAVPWYQVSQRLGRPPVLSYASYALNNWRRLDPAGPITLGNVVLLQNFLGGIDEEWFVLVHVEIEARAADAIARIFPAQRAVMEHEPSGLETSLSGIAAALRQMYTVLERMPERCDPFIYFHRVRPYLYGWKDQPALPQGAVYEGVAAYAGRPQKFRGETGAQSSIIPSLDAALGIEHQGGPLRAYLAEMRDYMPAKHRAFIEAVESGPSIRNEVLERRRSRPSLRDAYNECVHWTGQFRAKHFDYASRYVHQQSQRASANRPDIGTGGTPFMPYLKKHLDETALHRID